MGNVRCCVASAAGMFSIDQNCHSLWDVVPKLQALAARGRPARQFVEDVDVAFTEVGADSTALSTGGEHGRTGAARLHLERERFYRGGEADWGAAVFYHCFLGRQAADVREWEPLTGLSTKALAGQLGRTPGELYDEFSPGDNWQLIGPSYVGDGGHHRVLGDLTVAETADFLRRILRMARQDLDAALPEKPCQERLAEWFGREDSLLEELLARHAGGRLAEVYRDWIGAHMRGAADVDMSSRLFATDEHMPGAELLGAFVRDYDQAAGLYNQAIAEACPFLRPLDTANGELPFFAITEFDGHMVRAAATLEGEEIRIAGGAVALGPQRRLPMASLAEAGVRALAGKAVVLAIQARLGKGGAPLAVPYRGSVYLPASHRLVEKLLAAGLLKERPRPLVRVRLRLLDHLRSLHVTLRLPAHLAQCFGRDEVPARTLGENYEAVVRQAAERLELLKTPQGRLAWQERNVPDLWSQAEELDRRRRELAADPSGKSPELRAIWKRIKPLQQEMLRRTVAQIAADWQVKDIEYWDSRGAVLPACIGLGGREFYEQVITEAEVYEEPAA